MPRPFDLTKALAGEPIVTRSGIPAKIVYLSKREYNPPILYVSIQETEDGCLEESKWVTRDGLMWRDDETEDDLLMADQPAKKYYTNIYNKCGLYISGSIHHSEKEALEHAKNLTVPEFKYYIKTIEFELDETSVT